MLLSTNDIDDIMCTALEGGICYWCDGVTVEGEFLAKYASEQISRGGRLIFDLSEPYEDDENGNEIEKYTLTKEMFDKGFELYLRENGTKSVTDHKGEFDPCCVDADIADQIVQYALFGEVVYG